MSNIDRLLEQTSVVGKVTKEEYGKIFEQIQHSFGKVFEELGNLPVNPALEELVSKVDNKLSEVSDMIKDVFDTEDKNKEE